MHFIKQMILCFSPGYSFIKNNSRFRGDSKTDNKSNFNLGTSGAVFSFGSNSNWNNAAFSITVSRTANFNNRISYSGRNDYSSYGEQYASEAAASGLDINDVAGSDNVSIGTRLAAYTYLIDTLTFGGNTSPDIVSMAQWQNLKSGSPFLVNQQHSVTTTGGITEIAIGIASVNRDKFLPGGKPWYTHCKL